MNDLPKCSTEGERSLMKHFVRSLSMPHELLMSINTGKGKLARASKSHLLARRASWNSRFFRALTYLKRRNVVKTLRREKRWEERLFSTSVE